MTWRVSVSAGSRWNSSPRATWPEACPAKCDYPDGCGALVSRLTLRLSTGSGHSHRTSATPNLLANLGLVGALEIMNSATAGIVVVSEIVASQSARLDGIQRNAILPLVLLALEAADILCEAFANLL